jgi:hypothetical protein
VSERTWRCANAYGRSASRLADIRKDTATAPTKNSHRFPWKEKVMADDDKNQAEPKAQADKNQDKPESKPETKAEAAWAADMRKLEDKLKGSIRECALPPDRPVAGRPD